ncbi:hypothetical protein [Phyllobacterium salinisoli]|nr:hypothetical protein [Phyllobacterium salinisoli]
MRRPFRLRSVIRFETPNDYRTTHINPGSTADIFGGSAPMAICCGNTALLMGVALISVRGWSKVEQTIQHETPGALRKGGDYRTGVNFESQTSQRLARRQKTKPRTSHGMSRNHHHSAVARQRQIRPLPTRRERHQHGYEMLARRPRRGTE